MKLSSINSIRLQTQRNIYDIEAYGREYLFHFDKLTNLILTSLDLVELIHAFLSFRPIVLSKEECRTRKNCS